MSKMPINLADLLADTAKPPQRASTHQGQPTPKRLVRCPAGTTYDEAVHPHCPCPSCWADRAAASLGSGTVHTSSGPFRTKDHEGIDPKPGSASRTTKRRMGVGFRVFYNALILLAGAFGSYAVAVYVSRSSVAVSVPPGFLVLFAAFCVAWFVIARQKRRTTHAAPLSRFQKLFVIALAFLIALGLRTLLLQPFNIPGSGMEPAYVQGDYLLVAKYSYGFSHYSLPISPPFFSGRLLAFVRPKRGEVIVYRSPADDQVDQVSRVIGLPGDRVEILAGRLRINGGLAVRESMEDFVTRAGPVLRAKRWRERLPDSVVVEIIDDETRKKTEYYVVPPDKYFVMGDNRNVDRDGRWMTLVGMVPFENIIGPVRFPWPHSMRVSASRPLPPGRIRQASDHDRFRLDLF